MTPIHPIPKAEGGGIQYSLMFGLEKAEAKTTFLTISEIMLKLSELSITVMYIRFSIFS